MVLLSSGGKWLKAVDVKPGDKIKIVTEGEWRTNQKYTYEDGSQRSDFVVVVVHNDEEKQMRFNKMNRDTMAAMFGAETKEWVGKTVKLTSESALVGGKRIKMIIVIKVDKDGKEVSWDE